MLSYYDGDSLFHKMNPVAKLIAIGLSMIMLTFSFDPIVPGIMLILVLFLASVFGKVPLKAMFKGLIPFMILGLGFFWMHIVFPRDASGTIFTTLGSITIYEESLIKGSALFLRVTSFAAYALLFVSTTNPTHFLLSLMQQAKVPPVFGYSILAAYRFFPMYQSEYQILKEAHQVRGTSMEKGLRHRIKRFRRFAIPLLAQAIRKAERVAVAMEAKGFTGEKKRIYYTKLTVRWQDYVIAIILILIVPLIIFIAYQLGWLIIWRGGLFF